MKLICEISVFNRLAPNVKSRSQQSTLAIGYHPPGGTKDLENLFLIHFSATNKVGTRYKIKRNIEKVFTRFVNDGKITISLKQPSHDLQIKCDPTQVKVFLKVFKLALEGNYDPSKLGLSTLAVAGVPKKAIPVKKMTITTPADYPITGLPKTLVFLNVNGIRKHSIDSQILSLFNLRILDMSDNRIDAIPKRLGELPLAQLNLSKNRLGNAKFGSWDWLNNPTIQSSLQTIDFSDNQLIYFPYKLVKLRKLMILKLNKNNLTRLPFAIRRLRTLRSLELSGNRIESLPNVLNRMQFELVDLFGENMFKKPHPPVQMERSKSSTINGISQQPSELWQLAANVVLKKKLRYGPHDLPMVLIDMMEENPFCDCGKLCAPSKIHQASCLIQLKANSVITNDVAVFPADSVYCSDYCRARYQRI